MLTAQLAKKARVRGGTTTHPHDDDGGRDGYDDVYGDDGNYYVRSVDSCYYSKLLALQICLAREPKRQIVGLKSHPPDLKTTFIKNMHVICIYII